MKINLNKIRRRLISKRLREFKPKSSKFICSELTYEYAIVDKNHLNQAMFQCFLKN